MSTSGPNIKLCASACMSLDDVQQTRSLWKDDYNQTRPHSAWGGLAPEPGSAQRRTNQG
ncbi:MAG: transposase [Deltaproteobacteria bacterium]|nr:transposase [Deltaproteobacteria bacterium]